MDATPVELGLDTFGDISRGPDGSLQSDAQTIRNVVEQAVLADEVGLSFFGVGEHHRKDFAVTSPEIVLAAALVRLGHGKGLAVGQKNTPQLGASGRKQTGFDFVVAEECFVYQECGAYTKAYGKRVIDIEYTDNSKRPWSSVCASTKRPAMTILRDRDLVPAGDDAYVFEHC